MGEKEKDRLEMFFDNSLLWREDEEKVSPWQELPKLNDFVKRRLKTYLGIHLQNIHYLEGTDLPQPHLAKKDCLQGFWCVSMFLKDSREKDKCFQKDRKAKLYLWISVWETGL